MLCPEVWNFTPPKVISSCKQNVDLETVKTVVNMNNFYRSLIITCPDEINTPNFIEELIAEDTDYYQITNVSITELVDVNFIENFVKNGSMYCLSMVKNCIVENSAAITPDGVLTLHIPDYIYQTLGLEGTKRPNNYYEITINLNTIKSFEKLRHSLGKLGTFDFILYWEPDREDICPSSVAKYFYDKNIAVSARSPKLSQLSPTVSEIPSLQDVEVDEMAEWVGMLVHGVDVSPKPTYVSTYCQPDSESAITSTRISLLVAKGFFVPTLINRLCKEISSYVSSRQLENYWASISVQGMENCLWQWTTSSPKMFQSQSSSCNIFITDAGNTVYTVGQIKYS